MSGKATKDDIIKKTILESIKDRNAVFVFPTQICASMWADKTIEFSGTSAVALERFIAWDEFKGSSIRSRQQDKTSVPSIMRDIFAENIIKQNSQNPFLKKIVMPEYAKTASRFSSWIASVLPSLSMWKKYLEKNKVTPDGEDQDFLELYNRYKDFLDKNNFFDPAWETPPFDSNGKKYFIFFPEILMDYSEYKELLESTDDIVIVNIPQSELSHKPDAHYYKDTRVELREVVNYLRDKYENEKISWDKMSVAVPDLETYGPYIQRDFDIYEIPYAIKNGKPLSSSGAGRFFRQVLNCSSDYFSFESLKGLLFNKELPWKDEAGNNNLIVFGQGNNCLCSFEYEGKRVDVWEESFEAPLKQKPSVHEKIYYRNLKQKINALVSSKTFAEIRTGYFAFREAFFDFNKETFSEQNDKILSRCISELGSLIDLEEKYKDTGVFDIDAPFEFFCNYLDDKMYVPKNAESGVQILPYKTAACAPFDVHVIVDASQSSISVVYKQLTFLRDDKRAKLGFKEDSNITQKFITLYDMVSEKETLFTCSGETISAYGFTNSYLTEIDHNPGKKYADKSFIKDDSYLEERKSFLFKDGNEFPQRVFESAFNGFESWKKAFAVKEKSLENLDEILDERINRYFKVDGKVKISSTAMSSFFGCPRAFMMNKVLYVREMDDEAELIGVFTEGRHNHKILELYCKALKSNRLVLSYSAETDDIPESHKVLLEKAIEQAEEEAEESYLAGQILKTERPKFRKTILECVKKFSQIFNGFSPFENEVNYVYESPDDDYIIDGHIDCILKSPSDEFILIDFKNTKSAFPKTPYYSDDNIYPNTQLPLYKLIVEKGHKNDSESKIDKISACMFYAIKGNEKKVLYSDVNYLFTNGKEKKRQGEFNEMFEDTQNRCLEMADFYVEHLLDKNFSPELTEVGFEDCRSCDYRPICRRNYTLNGKRD
nr:PD-(D/E)XK nuclease family protein [uncultured Treponema sp.]